MIVAAVLIGPVLFIGWLFGMRGLEIMGAIFRVASWVGFLALVVIMGQITGRLDLLPFAVIAVFAAGVAAAAGAKHVSRVLVVTIIGGMIYAAQPGVSRPVNVAQAPSWSGQR
jgi:hypothetical protein